MNFQTRLSRAIPGGAHTYSRGADQFPSNAPPILFRGKGAYVWNPKGTKFLDYGMGLRSVTLGYAHEKVNRAAIKEINRGNSLTRPSITELNAAETMIGLIPGAEMVKFAKNGSNVTTAAVKLARAFTGRALVCVPRQHPFFSFDDWFIGSTPVKKGIPKSHYQNTLLFDYGKIESLIKLFKKYPGKIAAVMLEPATSLTPCPAICKNELSFDNACRQCPKRKSNFLFEVQALCRAHGSLFILDEMITGFRWHLQGAQTFFGVSPDLSLFGKAMANGFSVAALVGRRKIMELGAINKKEMERTFLLSSTHGAEMCSLGAFMETVNVYKNQNVCRYLWKYGKILKYGLNSIAADLNISENFVVEGPAVALNYSIRDSQGKISLPLRTLFCQEMIKKKILIPWISVSTAHGQQELDITLSAAEKSLAVLKNALHKGANKYLQGRSILPVFRKYN